MSTSRTLSASVLGVLTALTLAGCSLLLPQQPTTPEVSEAPEAPPVVVAEDLDDTTWSGVDSAGHETTFTFHSGGSTAVTYNGNSYDDPGDTWALDDATLTVTIYNVEGVGDASYVGEITDPAGPIELGVSFTDVTDTRTLSLTKG